MNFGEDGINLSISLNPRLFDGDETVALISEKAAALTHTETVHPSLKFSTEDVK